MKSGTMRMAVLLLPAVVAMLCLVGCAGSNVYSRMWENGGSLRLAEPDSATHDYKFYIKAGVDFGLNTELQEDRLKMYRGYLDGTCRDVLIVDEQFLPTGGVAVGVSKAGTYVSRVKCLK